MAYSIPIIIYVGEIEWEIIKTYQINVLEICTDAVKDAIDARNVMKAAVNCASDTFTENKRLRDELQKLRDENEKKKHPVIELTFTKKAMHAEGVIHGKRKI